MTQVYKLLNISDLAQAAMKHGYAPLQRKRKKVGCPNRVRKLSDVDVCTIRDAKAYCGIIKDLAEKYGVSFYYVKSIRYGNVRSRFDPSSVDRKP